VVDAHGTVNVGGGIVIVLPRAVVQRVLAGEELSPVMDAVTGEQETGKGPGAVGLLTHGALTRQRMFEDALVCALARWRHDAYGR